MSKPLSQLLPPKRGATGKFPDGKLNDTDEGELKMAVFLKGGLVHLDFGKPVTWIAMPPDKARELAAMLLKAAS